MRHFFTLLLFLTGCVVYAQTPPNKAHENAIKEINQKEKWYGALSKQIWNYAEVGYQEVKSSALLQEQLKKEGKQVTITAHEVDEMSVFMWGTPVEIVRFQT